MATKKTPTKTSATKASDAKAPAKKVVAKKETEKTETAKTAKKATVAAPPKEAPKKAAAPAAKKAAVAKKVVSEDKTRKATTTKKAAVAKPTEKKEKVETKEKKVAKPAAKAEAKPVAKKEKVEAKPVVKKEKVEAKAKTTTTKEKKAAPKAEVKAKKEKIEVKEKAPKAPKATATKEKKAKKEKVVAPAKKAPKRKKAVFVPAPPMGKSEIVDAVRLKPRKNVSKPGHVIAIRTKEKEEVTEEVSVTMEKYNPEQRSILDDVSETTGPIYRYSDEELNEFRELITIRLEKARKELNYLQGLITRKDEEGTEDTDNRFNHMEDGSGAMEREQLSQLAGRQVQFISHLENAMVRIENKTYGVCRVTGSLIDKARLRAVPHATLSIEAKNNLHRNR